MATIKELLNKISDFKREVGGKEIVFPVFFKKTMKMFY